MQTPGFQLCGMFADRPQPLSLSGSTQTYDYLPALLGPSPRPGRTGQSNLSMTYHICDNAKRVHMYGFPFTTVHVPFVCTERGTCDKVI